MNLFLAFCLVHIAEYFDRKKATSVYPYLHNSALNELAQHLMPPCNLTPTQTCW